jgi:DNA polymerase III subunit gamma/tau
MIQGEYAPSTLLCRRYGDSGGPLATIDSEFRQARKGATVIIDSCAGVWLSGSPPIFLLATFYVVLWLVYASRLYFGCKATSRMSYQVLARKWRPRIFREMVGQEHVLQALINALDHDRLHHAYLFTGTRGVGKTTIARILAKCLNCDQGVSSEPCGECGSCLEIAEGRSVDLWEIDAASRTKVEDTRELLENVQYAPTRSRFKIYLIDEVHMLSGHSFNALLKTLEEPPPHVKFLFATTDPQKLPATILSRCLQFNLKNMLPEQIVSHLTHVLEQEVITCEPPALWLLGRAAQGSMRDALSLTDQAIAFGSGKLGEDDVRSMLGTVDLNFIYQLMDSIIAGESAQALDTVRTMAEHSPDFEGSLDELISLVHRIALAQAVPDAIDNNWGDAEKVGEMAIRLTPEDTQLYYQVCINGKRDISLATDPRSGFEMLVLRMIAFRPEAVLDTSLTPADLTTQATVDVAREVDPTVKKPLDAPVRPAPVASTVPVTATPQPAPKPKSKPPWETAPEPAPAPRPAPEPASAPAPAPRPVVEPAVKPAVEAAAKPPWEAAPEPAPALKPIEQTAQVAPATEPVAPAPQANATSSEAPIAEHPQNAEISALTPTSWPDMLEHLGLLGIVYNIASNCELRSVEGNTLGFVLSESSSSLFNDGHTQKIRVALENYFSSELSVSVTAGPLQGETPAMISERKTRKRQEDAVIALEGDPVLNQLIERFDGELDRTSIVPLES